MCCFCVLVFMYLENSNPLPAYLYTNLGKYFDFLIFFLCSGIYACVCVKFVYAQNSSYFCKMLNLEGVFMFIFCFFAIFLFIVDGGRLLCNHRRFADGVGF